MILYDKKSPVRWFPSDSETSVADMKDDPRYAGMFGEQCVLMDDGAGSVYSWVYLSALAARYGAEEGETPDGTLANIEAAMAVPPRDPLVEIDEQAGAIEELAAMASDADVQEQLDEQAAAIEELATIVASNSKEEANG